MKVFRLIIRQGKLMVTAHSRDHAEAQADAFERDAQRYWVRQQAEVAPGMFALGSAAKVQAGVEVFGG